MNATELELIVESLLVEGVPPGIVARVFELEPDLVKDIQRQVRVKRYGTDDLTEFTEQLQWDAIDKAREVIFKGSAVDSTRFVSAILGKQIALAARRTPDSQRRATDAVLKLFEDMRTGEPDADPEEEEQSKFVAKAGNPDA